jgi:hemerythrin
LTSHFGFFTILDVKIEVMREKKKEKKEKKNALLELIQTSPIHT